VPKSSRADAVAQQPEFGQPCRRHPASHFSRMPSVTSSSICPAQRGGHDDAVDPGAQIGAAKLLADRLKGDAPGPASAAIARAAWGATVR